MQPSLSTHVFLQQRLHPGLLDALHKSGAQTVKIFAARHHFDYSDRAAVRDIAAWFRNTGVAATVHQPLYFSDRGSGQWSRHVAPNLNLIDPEKSRRIAAMDEVKRALESAEQIPISPCTLHLGYKDDAWNLRALENSLTAIEHPKAFPPPLGVRIVLENLQNEITTPEHLLEIIKVGHFDRVGVTLDLGHAHLAAPDANKGIDEAFELLKPRIAELHIHDNLAAKDDHLWPGIAGIDWKNIARHIATLPDNIPGILEIAHELEETPESATSKATQAFDLLKRAAEQIQN